MAGDFVALRDEFFRDVLQDASYEAVSFPVGRCPTEGGHDAAEHTAYRRPGADIEPTGRQAYRGSLTIPLINGLPGYGELFPGTYRELLRQFEGTPIGELAHPTKGTFRAFIKSWNETFDPETRNGVVLEVQWVEHNAEAGAQLADGTTSPTDTPTAAAAQAAAADTAMAAAGVSGYTAVAATFTAQLAFLEAQVRTYGEIQSAVNAMLTVVDANLALAGFATLTTARAWEIHAAVAALEALRATTRRLAERYLGTLARPQYYVVPRTMPLFQVAQLVYGDASKASLLAAANAVHDPLFVRAGTRLTVLPAA